MRLRVLFVLTTLLVAPLAFGGTYTLSDWCFYVNSLDVNQSCNAGGGLANVPSANVGVTDTIHLQNDGTGSVTVTLAPGQYNVFAIFNYNANNTGGGDFGSTIGSLSVGQVYSVNNEGGSGGLYQQGQNGTLDNTNHCVTGCSDVAVAIGYTNVNVPDGGNGTITYNLGNPPSDPNSFDVHQTNPGSGSSIDISSGIQIDGGLQTLIAAAPEPGAMGLMGAGLGALLYFVRRRRA